MQNGEAMTADTKKQWMKIVAKSWADEDFKARLLSDPAAVLSEEGISVPAGTTIKVVEEAAGEAVFVLPAMQEGKSPQDVEERIAAAFFS